MSVDPLISRYSWVNEIEGWTVAVPRPRRVADVLRIYGGDAVVANFEPLYPLAPDVRPWERRPSWAIGAEVGPALARQVCMAQLERPTGVAVERGWLTRPCPAFRIPEPHRLYRDVDGADRV